MREFPQHSTETEPDTTRHAVFFHRWIAWGMIGVVIVSLTTWYFTQERLPRIIFVGTAAEGGLYHKLGGLLGEQLQKRVNREVKLVPSRGSRENMDRLAKKEIDFAILQSSLLASEPVAVLAPLYKEPVHIIVRLGSGITNLNALKGRRVSLGPEGSGMRESARQLLDHFQISFDSLAETDRYFLDLLNDNGPDAAVVTTGIENPDLERVLSSRKFRILTVENADAIVARSPSFTPFRIPRGLYGENPSVPIDDVATIATTAVLVATPETPSLLVDAALESLYTNPLTRHVPSLISKKDAAEWSLPPLHEIAQRFHSPYEGLGLLANLMESIAAIKELLFALAAILYLAWSHWQKLVAQEHAKILSAQKEHLDSLLNETIRIEKAQMESKDPDELKEYLDEVTRIKLRALEELTDEDLRGDQFFAIFLTQCANLIRKIQSKLFLLLQTQPPVAGVAKSKKKPEA